MMKRNIKFLLLALLLVTLMPLSAQAQGASDRETEFCGKQADRQIKIKESFEKNNQTYEEAVKKQGDNQKSRRGKLDDELARVRNEADKKRGLSLTLMEIGQATEEEKALARAYIDEVNVAIADRRKAYDQAVEVFQGTVDDLLLARDTHIRAALQEFRVTAGAAMDVAVVACNSVLGDRPAARIKMIDDLRNARVAYGDKLRARQDFRTGVREAVEVRSDAFKFATESFQQAMQKIREKYPAL